MKQLHHSPYLFESKNYTFHSKKCPGCMKEYGEPDRQGWIYIERCAECAKKKFEVKGKKTSREVFL